MTAAGVVFLAIAQHPFVTYPLSLAAWARFRRPHTVRSDHPTASLSVSILCCCHNEEKVIAEKAENLIQTSDKFSGESEILFYLDDCTDGTEDILRGYGDKIKAIKGVERAGKSVGMKHLVAMSSGDILVFTDANTFVSPDGLLRTIEAFGDDHIGGVSGWLRYTNPRDSITSQVNSGYWSWEERLKQLESRTGSIVGADGAWFAIRRELYTPTPPDIIDDLHTSMCVVLSGSRFVSLPAVETFEKTSTKSGEEFRRKVRISCRAFNAYRLMAPRIHSAGGEVAYKFYSHRVLRWLSLPFAAIGMALLSGGLIQSGYWEVVAVGGFSAAIGLTLGAAGVRPFSAVLELLSAMTAVSLGIWESLRGKRYQIWSAATSGR